MKEKFLEFMGKHYLNPKNNLPDRDFIRRILGLLLPINSKLCFVERERRSIEKDFYFEEHIKAQLGSIESESVLLRPKGVKPPFPVVIAFHDHGGYYFHGKERLYMDASPGSFMFEYRKKGYQGRRWVLDLVENGFAVFCPDAFYFGSRRLKMEIIKEFVENEVYQELISLEEGSDEYVRLFNKISSRLEPVIWKNINLLGISWPVVLLSEDIAWINYLLTREDIDRNRMGSVGFSLGGFRSFLTSALKPEIKACAVVCFMGEFDGNMLGKYATHTFMVHIPSLSRYMSFPDIAGLIFPRDLLIMVGEYDHLFPKERIPAIKEKLEKIYEQLPEKLSFEMFPEGHVFSVEMQERSIKFFKKTL